MAATRRVKGDDLPKGWGLEIWDDNTVWLVSPNTDARVRMVEWAAGHLYEDNRTIWDLGK